MCILDTSEYRVVTLCFVGCVFLAVSVIVGKHIYVCGACQTDDRDMSLRVLRSSRTSRDVNLYGSSVVECRTRNREGNGSKPPTPFATVSKFGHFRSLHDASVDSAVYMSTWL